jgi:ThiS family.
MRITIECCGVARRWCGSERLPLDLEAPATVADAAAELARRFPEFSDSAGRLAWAIGDRIVPVSQPMNEGDELAVIPPVSGG